MLLWYLPNSAKKKLRAIRISDVTACDDLKKFIEYIDANSYKNPLIARLD